MRQVLIGEIARHLGGSCESGLRVSGYQIDSRLIQPGEVFFALRGEKSDGHWFLEEVRARGGEAAIVSKGYTGPDYGLVLLAVDDVALSLQELARWSLSKSQVQIVGITGSVGKTTTKEFAAQLLGGRYRVGKNLSSYNTKLTLPLTILNRTGNEEILILEMGMSEPGDIQRLLEIAQPDLAVVTKVALAHSAFFPEGLRAIAQEKATLFSHPKTEVAIFDHGLYEFPEAVSMANQRRKISFSLSDKNADYFLSPCESAPNICCQTADTARNRFFGSEWYRFAIDERGVRAYLIDLPFQEPHILHNFLAAASIARQMKVEWDEINAQVEGLQLPKMRFERFEEGGISFINDAYNSNPESVRAALSNLPVPRDGGKRIAVLGSMKELGAFSSSAHQEIGRFAQKYIDHLLVLGEEAALLCEAFLEAKKPGECFSDHESLAKRLASIMSPGDVVLVKGSLSMKMGTVFELLRAL